MTCCGLEVVDEEVVYVKKICTVRCESGGLVSDGLGSVSVYFTV